MKIAVLKERRPFEQRVAASPETVRKLIERGVAVTVEAGAGSGAHISDDEFSAVGAEIGKDGAATLDGADVVLKVSAPMRAEEGVDEVGALISGQHLIAMLDPLHNVALTEALADKGVTAFALELMPRITRAQAMDVLSSQASLAGYKAVLDACEHFNRAMPMMMSAAGTIAPARVFVMGAGVAGLQAIATARRLGAVVAATDVRPVAKEHVESLGASFVMVEDEENATAETKAGYAKEMSAAYREKQAALIADTIPRQDIVITTALIPGKAAPILVTEQHVASMRPGSVVVDLAVEAGGNCAHSKPGEVIEVAGVTIVGHLNVASRLADDASALYAKNIFAFIAPHIDPESGDLNFDFEDETVAGTCVTRGGEIVHPDLKPAPARVETG